MSGRRSTFLPNGKFNYDSGLVGRASRPGTIGRNVRESYPVPKVFDKNTERIRFPGRRLDRVINAPSPTNQLGQPHNWAVQDNPAARRRAAIDNSIGPIAGIAGSAALLSSSLVPVAAGLGIGYGVYKLGESFSLW